MLQCETTEVMKRILKPKLRAERSTVDYCRKFKVYRLLVDNYAYASPKGGETVNGSVREYDKKEWMKRKSMHLRLKLLQKRLKGVVKPEHVATISIDFVQVVHMLIKKGTMFQL